MGPPGACSSACSTSQSSAPNQPPLFRQRQRHGRPMQHVAAGMAGVAASWPRGTAAETRNLSTACRAGGALDKFEKLEAAGPPSADLQRRKGCCYGCGAKLQIEVPLGPGFVKPDKYETKKKHRQLDKVLCERCAELCNGAMIPAVQDFTQRLQAQQAAQQAQQQAQHQAQQAQQAQQQQQQQQALSAEERLELLGKVLVSPEQLRTQLLEVKDKKAVVVMVVDLLDASGSLMTKVRDVVGKNPIVLVGTKMDLLPEGCHPRDVAEWLMEAATRKRLNVVSVHLVSNHNGEGVAAATSKICRERKGRDVYVIGAANVGKSAFVRAMLRDMGQFNSDNFDPAAMSNGRYLPVESAMPGTTLGIIPLQAFASGGTLYDTPGVHLHHRVPHMLSPAELKKLHPRKRLAAFVPPAPRELSSDEAAATDARAEAAAAAGPSLASASTVAGADGGRRRGPGARPAVSATYVWGGLVRLDVVAAPPSTALAFFGPPCLRVYSVPLLKADQKFILEDNEEEEEPAPRSARTSTSGRQAAASLSSSSPNAATAQPAGAVASSSKDRDRGSELVCTASVEARGGLVAHDLLVKTTGGVGIGGKSGALADIAVSGIPGWVTAWAPRAKHDIHLRVWAPRGVEIFLRPPIPCPSPVKDERSAGGAEEGEITKDQLVDIMDEYGDSLSPVNDARWWEAAVSELDGVDLGEDDEEEDGDQDGEDDDEAEQVVVVGTVEDILRRPRMQQAFDFLDEAEEGEEAAPERRAPRARVGAGVGGARRGEEGRGAGSAGVEQATEGRRGGDHFCCALRSGAMSCRITVV